MPPWLRKCWPLLKLLFTAAILFAVGRQFARDLQNPGLWRRSLHPGWLALAGGLYLLGLGFSALFWYRLLRTMGQRPTAWTAVRAYYLGHMGKYLPGKAWALVLRASLVRGPGVRVGVAGLTALYEVLTTMAAGALVAAVLFALQPAGEGRPLARGDIRGLLLLNPPDQPLDRTAYVVLALLVLLPIALPLVPALFNRVARRMSLPGGEDAEPLPRLRLRSLAEGLSITSLGWVCLGASLWAVLQAVLDQPPAADVNALRRVTAIVSLAYVIGFLILLAPSGIGVREFFLTVLLVAELGRLSGVGTDEARAAAVLAVVLLRLVWTAAELVAVAVLYPLPGPQRHEAAVIGGEGTA